MYIRAMVIVSQIDIICVHSFVWSLFSMPTHLQWLWQICSTWQCESSHMKIILNLKYRLYLYVITSILSLFEGHFIRKVCFWHYNSHYCCILFSKSCGYSFSNWHNTYFCVRSLLMPKSHFPAGGRRPVVWAMPKHRSSSAK